MFLRMPPVGFLKLAAVLWAVAALLGGVWLAGGLYTEYYVDGARQCAPDQVFTGAHCRATLDGTLTRSTASRIEVDVQGRPMGEDIFDKGLIPNHPGDAVRVTLYEGKVISVDWQGVSVTATDSPAGTRQGLGVFGVLFLLLGAFAGILGFVRLLIESGQRGTARPPYGR